ncbi:uncharacterized protein PHALS_14338 [Plasmopara halstedii]|uniref:Uncharacterized protein n=1 Tax=Plasmopara halstedii TaxID=4781 RepID=A0A0P1AR68_PLAHL|nr:uncharacterized protein PHALS_14338 [Plasmopara halstedii]CEG44070.1 hypothetical protein PHALS_14338 [Plasmopara halstedii]|eukprot:XP_024580439.1 hypothetical protein PHALS_14338 [Plasmopara halstedii]
MKRKISDDATHALADGGQAELSKFNPAQQQRAEERNTGETKREERHPIW